MKNSAFLVFSLILFSSLVALHALFQSRLNPTERLEARLRHVEHQRGEAEFRAQLASHRLADYQQEVATILPEALKNKAGDEAFSYPLRQLASVVGATNQEVLVIERASSLFEKAKAAFREQQYEDSNAVLQDLIAHYPESMHVIEAHFLLAEGQYKLKEKEASVGTIERMIVLFPESELTGFALLRLGRIFETEERLEDAADMYRAVLANFQEPELRRQASLSLKAVQL